MKPFVFATNNRHKLEEVAAILGDFAQIRSLSDIHCHTEIPETGTTLTENALQKAHFVFDNYHCDCFADDTGLEVEALGGEPGVFSARYAGETCNSAANIDKLLHNLSGKTNRKARFRTVIALIIDSKEHLFEGIIRGEIIEKRRGTNGFGYDSVFVPEGYDCTFAELPAATKNAISHRAKAMEKLAQFLNNKQKQK